MSLPEYRDVLLGNVEHLARFVQLLLPLAAVLPEVAVGHAKEKDVGLGPGR